MATATAGDIAAFKKKLATYKQLIDEDIESYTKQVARTALQQYGPYSSVAVDAYLNVLKRGGKRIRGALTMLGYEMSGGKDQAMILQAARAIEMVHAYILIIDDINDRSHVRRGGKAAHIQIEDYYKKHEYGQDAEHFGESIAMNAALLGSHAAQMIMANLNAPEDLRLNAISILNRGMAVTVHGQFNDMFNEVVAEVTEADVDHVTEWKTAHYTFLNPLHIGMILAGADCQATDAITEYAMQVGRAFQISDDIIGTFGSEFEIGKSPLDDMHEGKRTLLVVYALEHTNGADKNFLVQMLGNQNLSQIEFERVKTILIDCGALKHAQERAKQHVSQALASLDKSQDLWSKDGVQFLRGIAQYILTRTA